MPTSAAAYFRLLVPAAIFAFATIGCKGLNMPSLPIVDDLNLFPNENVPAEIAAKYGPASLDTVSAIKRQGESAKNASLQERQRIAQSLAQQIQQEDNPLLRQHVVAAIAVCRTPLAGAVIRAALSDEDIDVQIEACRAWGDWGTVESVEVLGQVINNESAELDVKLAAATALGGIRQPGTVEALSVALEKGQNPALQHRAMLSLEQVTKRDFGNDLVAWRKFSGGPKQDAATFPVFSGKTEPVEPFAKRVLFWWK